MELCRKDDPSAQVDLPFGMIARREYDQLWIQKRQEPVELPRQQISREGTYLAADWLVECQLVLWQGEKSSPYEFYLRESSSLELRARQIGDELKLPNRARKTVKKWMVEEKVPRHLRDTLPVLLLEGQVAAVAGLGVDESAQPQPEQKAWHIIIRNGEQKE